MSRNTVMLDDSLWVFDQVNDTRVIAYKTTYLGKFIGEQETMTPEQAISQLMWLHKSGYQVSTELV